MGKSDDHDEWREICISNVTMNGLLPYIKTFPPRIYAVLNNSSQFEIPSAIIVIRHSNIQPWHAFHLLKLPDSARKWKL